MYRHSLIECALCSDVGADAVWALFFFSSRRRHTRFDCDWSSDVCSSDLSATGEAVIALRGTEGILEWLHDAAFLLVKCPFLPGAGSTEDGFTAMYGSLTTGVAAGSPTVAKALTGLNWTTPVSAITICGHSL